jgi:hypothetical protein
VIGKFALVTIDSSLPASNGLLLCSAPGSPVILFAGGNAFLDIGSSWIVSHFLTDANGGTVLNLPVPETMLRCADTFTFRAVVISASNQLRFGAPTNGLQLTIGR